MWDPDNTEHSPPRSSVAPPAPLPPFRARFRVTLLWSSGTGALTREKSSSVASFLKAWQLLRRMQSTSREWHDSYALRCMLTAGRGVSPTGRWTDAGCGTIRGRGFMPPAVSRLAASQVRLGWEALIGRH